MDSTSSYTIFISYRREDSQASSDHIYDRLVAHFGKDAIFKDVNAIPPGYQFASYINSVLRQCLVVLVIIGPSWSTITSQKDLYKGQPRLNDPGDFVRIEVEQALSLAPVNEAGQPMDDLLLIPVLVQGANMPHREDLPESLRELAARNATPVHPDPYFDHDIQGLVAYIADWISKVRPEGSGKAGDDKGASDLSNGKRLRTLSRRKLLLGTGALAAAATGIGVGIKLRSSQSSHPVIPGTTRWRFQTNAALDSSPAVSNGFVYVGAGDGTVYALDARSGSKRWSYATGSDGTSSPVVANGLVYVGAWLGSVYALDARTGEEQWSFETDSDRDYIAGWRSSIAMADGVIFLNTSGGIVYALDARTGVKWWSFDTGSPLYLPPIAVGNRLYVNSADGYTLYTLDSHTGEKQWSYQTENGVSTPAVAGGLVYVGEGDGSVYELDAAIGRSQRIIARLGTDDLATTGPEELWPILMNGVLYVSLTNVGSTKGSVYALEGALWSFQVDGKVTVTSPPTIANGVVYIGVHRKEGDGTVYALNTHTGAKEWSYKTNGGVNSSPVVANGMVYVGAEDGYVYALNA